LKTLTGRESAGATVALRGERLYSGLYVNELLVRLLHRHDPHPRLFAAYGQALAALGDVAVPLDGTLRRFELTLLDELGYRLQLDIASDGGRSVSHYRFDSELGLVGCSGADSSSTDRYPVDHLVAMSRGEFDGAARQSAKRLLRQALAVHLGDRPLHSRALFQQAVLPVADKPDNTGPGHRA
jgi:DNA repair protein RecO (recombination protein O)